jgi:serine/threonine-protein kinase
LPKKCAVADEPLLHAASRIADGEFVDWLSVTSTLPSENDRAIADELALVAQIAAGHRQLHQILPASADTPPNLVPDLARWGHLELLNIVGRGSYGTVYRAWDTRLERLVALKLFHGAVDPELVLQEGRMLARMRHENVVTVYGADVIDGVAGIWMELIHGRTLDNMVRKDGAMPVRDAAAIGADVARALATVHAAGVLHCDVKAQNVVREASGRVVLMDFGAGRIAPEYRDADEVSDVAGTPRYMAPELFKAGTTATKATDIYSFGILLYFLVTARFPIEGRTLGELKSAHESGNVLPVWKARKGLPSAFVDVVTRAIAHDPALRPVTTTAMQEALDSVARRATGIRFLARWQWWLIAIVVAGLAFVAYRSMVTPAPSDGSVSIAVLPIRNLTGDPAQSYLADGLTEGLIANLARIRSLRVPSFAAVAPYRSADAPPAPVARSLGVDLLLAGSFTQSGSRVRLALQLIDPASGDAIWGEEITRDAAGMFNAHAEITRRVTARLALRLSADEAVALAERPIDSRAQDYYLRGVALAMGPPAASSEAANHFRRALEIDPNFAEAWAELALIEVRLIESAASLDRRARADFAREMALKAVSLDPGLASAHAALATVQFYYDWDFDGAERSLRRAIEVNPSHAFSRQRLALLLAARNRLDDAIALGRESQRLEPTVPIRTESLGMLYYYARDFSRAIDEMRRAAQLSPALPAADFGLGRIYAAQGRHAEAIAALEKAVAADRNPGWLVELARAYTAAGHTDAAAKLLAELTNRERAGESYSLDNLAYIAAADGRVDDAFVLLDEAVRRRLVNVLWIAVDPRVDSLRADPRFQPLLDRMGILVN